MSERNFPRRCLLCGEPVTAATPYRKSFDEAWVLLGRVHVNCPARSTPAPADVSEREGEQ